MIPAAVRSALVEHAEAESPNEACGLIVLRGETAVRYEPAENRAASPYRFELYFDPVRWMDVWDENDLAVFHSHPASPPRPSRTDVENIGQWRGYPYVILSLRTGELAAWRIEDGRIEPLELAGNF